jgi:hypothetical protein
MAKKSLKKATKQLAPDASVKRSDRAYPVEPEELDVQHQRIRKVAAAGAELLKSSAPAPTPDLHPGPAAVSPQPLNPLAALWPSPAPAQGASKPAQAPAGKVQAGPVKAAPPQTSPPPAARPAKLPIVWESPTTSRKAAVVAEAAMPPASPHCH